MIRSAPRFVAAIFVASASVLPAELQLVGTSPQQFALAAASGSEPGFHEVLAAVNPWGLACHPDTGVVYYSDPIAGAIRSLDFAAVPPADTPILTDPAAVFHGISLDAANDRLFFLDSADDTVKVLDLGSSTVTPLLSGFGITRPNDLVYDPQRNWILFTDSGGDFVGVFSVDQPFTLVAKISSPETFGAWGIALHPVSGEVYFSSHDLGSVYRLDPAVGTSTPVASGLINPRGLAFDRHGRLFCLESGSDRVVQIDLATGSVSAPHFTGAMNGRGFVIFEGGDKDGDFLPDMWERRFVSSVLDLDAASDPEMDQRSAMHELLFNGRPDSNGDPPPVQLFELLPDGEIRIGFEGPSAGYDIEVWLSSDQQDWTSAGTALSKSPLADPLYSFWDLTVDPVTMGLNPARVFLKLGGSPAGP